MDIINMQDFQNTKAKSQYSADLYTVQSGFENLDKCTKMYPGLYVLGAISSLGKTTFALQLADQIAAGKHNVLYFVIEQTINELWAKSIARTIKQHKLTPNITSLDIRSTEASNPVVQEAAEIYQASAEYMHVVNGNFFTTIQDIEDTIGKFVAETKQTPVVFIDYLQIISKTKPGCDTRSAIDECITKIKTIQQKYNLIVVLISSLNRSSYSSVVDCESLKESGCIEYTADVIWGLQLTAVHDPARGTSDKKASLLKAKAADPRELELVCLKNRYGKVGYTCRFNYFTSYDLFVPKAAGKNNHNSNVTIEDEGVLRNTYSPFSCTTGGNAILDGNYR